MSKTCKVVLRIEFNEDFTSQEEVVEAFQELLDRARDTFDGLLEDSFISSINTPHIAASAYT